MMYLSFLYNDFSKSNNFLSISLNFSIMQSVEAIDALNDRGGSSDNAISHYEVYMKELKEDKTVQLMESAVIALENIASVLVQISYHMGADLPVKAVMPVSDRISGPVPEIEVNTAESADTESAETEPAKAEEVPAPEPAKEEPETVLESLTLEDLRQACITASQRSSNAKNVIRSILTEKYGVKNISGLDTKDYYAFWKEIQSL